MPENDIEVVHSAWNELKSMVKKECGLRKEDIELPIICQELHTILFFTSAIIQTNILCFWRWFNLGK